MNSLSYNYKDRKMRILDDMWITLKVFEDVDINLMDGKDGRYTFIGRTSDGVRVRVTVSAQFLIEYNLPDDE